MKNAVLIKSFQNGIAVQLDPELEFEELLAEIAIKFKESDSFFKNAKMALSLKGRKLSDAQEQQILETIYANSRLQIICLVEKEEETDQLFLKAIEQTEEDTGEEKGRFYRGNLKKGQALEVDGSVIVVGDVDPGAAIIAGRDIIVLGGLYGKAYAGAAGRNKSFVAALEMAPEKIKIGDFKYRTKEKGIWPLRPGKRQPKMAFVHGDPGEIVIEPLTKDLLDIMPV